VQLLVKNEKLVRQVNGQGTDILLHRVKAVSFEPNNNNLFMNIIFLDDEQIKVYLGIFRRPIIEAPIEE